MRIILKLIFNLWYDGTDGDCNSGNNDGDCYPDKVDGNNVDDDDSDVVDKDCNDVTVVITTLVTNE